MTACDWLGQTSWLWSHPGVVLWWCHWMCGCLMSDCVLFSLSSLFWLFLLASIDRGGISIQHLSANISTCDNMLNVSQCGRNVERERERERRTPCWLIQRQAKWWTIVGIRLWENFISLLFHLEEISPNSSVQRWWASNAFHWSESAAAWRWINAKI